MLSACDTGLGEIKTGEGVFGLRRAFQVAGARTLIMSLWSVEDQATATLMTAFYRSLTRRRPTTPADALRSAQLRMLAAQRETGQGDPSAWAGFIAVGP